MEVSGSIKVINAEQQVSATFKKRELVVTTDEQYPQHIMIEFTQDKCDLLNQYNVGDFVKVSINLRGREWTNPQGEVRYFNSIQGWRIEKNAAETSAPSASAAPAAPAPPIPAALEGEDDLPF
ncbi:MAG: DUF3127 domain-containing protein [Cytophagaceae bacterium]|nr:DUF3127 domain-containing protein [Cytophagaceae bacterium]MBK9509014.1 DUF3127 domain-containing protein [Cytophagaceae bacterium]MBK9935912.1 DUF3127 domain-containing protein [Cytophagaceae bacterium]MBL0302354.1 DUF3127 domain-containing protein [Cytophagaceae bacterium]MBL0325174.1 DUF3127 domain-containing protein [Cytophagaceae bacterium]